MIQEALPLRGRTCVITGATSGIGRATAFALSAAGANLVLAGRREPAGTVLASRLQQRPGAGWAKFFRADISEHQQVHELASRITARCEQVDILVNNAGAKFDTFQESSDGIELTFATNYLGHFLLTCLLLESLLRAERAKVISVGSGAHGGIGVQDGWYLGKANYNRKNAYGKSKLANIVFSYELARRLQLTRVVSNAVDPGGVATNLGRNNGLLSWCRHFVFYGMKGKLLSPRRGAQTVIHLAMDHSLDGLSGKYFYEKHQVGSSTTSRDREVAANLWSLSVALTRLDDQIGPAWECINPHARESINPRPSAPHLRSTGRLSDDAAAGLDQSGAAN
jgi:NAD(P)-dependent dehydrogenase (short-subunit alcohol dehydrogenase family)